MLCKDLMVHVKADYIRSLYQDKSHKSRLCTQFFASVEHLSCPENSGSIAVNRFVVVTSVIADSYNVYSTSDSPTYNTAGRFERTYNFSLEQERSG